MENQTQQEDTPDSPGRRKSFGKIAALFATAAGITACDVEAYTQARNGGRIDLPCDEKLVPEATHYNQGIARTRIVTRPMRAEEKPETHTVRAIGDDNNEDILRIVESACNGLEK